MSPKITPQEFVSKWRSSTLKERAGSQSHFNDICYLVGHQTPAEMDPTGSYFTFEAGATKTLGGQGWADVWKRHYFAWEYKGKHHNLDKAYAQLLQYHEALESPPLLVVSDFDTIVIHTKFLNSVKRVYTLTLDDLLIPEKLAILKAVFFRPDELRATETPEQVTQEAAANFARIAELLRRYGEEPSDIALFLIRLLFCLFAEDVGLLPEKLFSNLVENTRTKPGAFIAQMRQLFLAMSEGGWFGSEEIKHFNGHLFEDATVLELDSDSMEILARVCRLDWSAIEPSVLGTLFERSLDPSKRSQLGAHYTSRQDILLIVEPVLMQPLRRKWAEIQDQAKEIAIKRGASTGKKRSNLQNQLSSILLGFAEEISNIKVLDPACGSGNFLYVALRQLLNLWKEVSTFAWELGLPALAPHSTISPSPEQLHGIEINEYAHKLAQATIWIGYIQWFSENGFGFPSEPILKPLDNIWKMDAILAIDDHGQSAEPEWPDVDVIVGNPPFLGDKKMRSELGGDYVEVLRGLYNGRVPGGADLVTYWFEKARAMIEYDQVKRAGLLATQGIRGGKNRKVLDQIKETGDIFFAESDREWILSGAMVHVSMIAFDKGLEQVHMLNGEKVHTIYSNLTTSLNITIAKILKENQAVSFLGNCKGGPFDIPEEQALDLLNRVGNPNGLPNSDLIRPVCNSQDLIKIPTNRWIIDTANLDLKSSSQYEAPFEIITTFVKPKRDLNRDKWLRENWWRPQRMRYEMREAIKSLPRYLVTTTTSKHRLFLWLFHPTLPDHQLVVFGRSDDYFFGILHSRVHEIWALAQGTQLREKESGFRYTPTTCFETFPFPFIGDVQSSNLTADPSLLRGTSTDTKDKHRAAVAAAAKDLNEKRENWLKPPEWVKEQIIEFPGSINGPWAHYLINANENGIGTVRFSRLEPNDADCAAKLKTRTLTNLYNQRPTWLVLAHQKLDRAVFDAYGWLYALSDDQILERLLELNLKRAI